MESKIKNDDGDDDKKLKNKNKLSDDENDKDKTNKKIKIEPKISDSLKDVVEPKNNSDNGIADQLICTICNEIMHDCVRFAQNIKLD